MDFADTYTHSRMKSLQGQARGQRTCFQQHSNKSNLRSDSCGDFPEDAELLTCITRDSGHPNTAREIHSPGYAIRRRREQWPRTPVEIFQEWPCQAMHRQRCQLSGSLYPYPGPVSAQTAENLGQPVLSRVQLLSFVYFYILKTAQLLRVLLPSSLLANFNIQSPS